MVNAVYRAQAKLVSCGYKPMILWLTPRDHSCLIKELDMPYDVVRTFLGYDILVDTAIEQSRLETIYPYSLMDEGKELIIKE